MCDGHPGQSVCSQWKGGAGLIAYDGDDGWGGGCRRHSSVLV